MFIELKTHRREVLINTDHIIRVVPPYAEGMNCHVYMNEMDVDGNLWYSVKSPSYEEIKEILCGLR